MANQDQAQAQANPVDIVEVAQSRLLSGYSKRVKKDISQISPDLISLLLELAMSLLGDCFAKGGSPESVIRKPIISRTLIRIKLRQSGDLNRSDREQIIEALIDAGEQSTDQEMLDFVNSANFNV